MNKPFSVACERNRGPILVVLQDALRDCRHVLEIGSGTGQHAVYFGGALPHLVWQTSDLPENHEGIRAWLNEAGLPNVLAPLPLDASGQVWPREGFDAAYTANTCHIMSWDEVEAMFAGVGRLLPDGGLFCIYGPFNYNGRFTSDSNAQFDAMLRAQVPHRGIRDMENIVALASAQDMRLQDDHAMPANNRLLVFRKG